MRKQSDIEAWMLEHKEYVAAHIEKGFAQAERGELIDGDIAFEILRQRRAQRQKQKKSGLSGNQRQTRVLTLLWRWLNLHKLPSKTAFDAEVAVGHAVVQRRGDSHDFAVLLVNRQVAAYAA